MSLNVRVIAPDQTVWDAKAEEIILPSTTGQLGILTNHAPLLTALEIGVMRVKSGKEWVPIALFGGFAEIENNEVTILVNAAERGDQIDKEKAKESYTKANQRLESSKTASLQEQIKAKQAMKKAKARLQAAGGIVD
ncbi:MAG: ATP synthase F1 subunit epsilon [Microcoleaceae cyanobacterium]